MEKSISLGAGTCRFLILTHGTACMTWMGLVTGAHIRRDILLVPVGVTNRDQRVFGPGSWLEPGPKVLSVSIWVVSAPKFSPSPQIRASPPPRSRAAVPSPLGAAPAASPSPTCCCAPPLPRASPPPPASPSPSCWCCSARVAPVPPRRRPEVLLRPRPRPRRAAAPLPSPDRKSVV